MTPQERNKGVAEALGLDIIKSGRNTGLVYWRDKKHTQFNPAEDERAAVWALEKWCDEHDCAATLKRSRLTKKWSCSFLGEAPYDDFDTQREAICNSIIESAKGRA